MNNYEEEEFYRQKYLKYKTKYLEAKNELEGGIGESITASKCGKYLYFLSIPEPTVSGFPPTKDISFDNVLQTELNNGIKNENIGYKVDKTVLTIANSRNNDKNLEKPAAVAYIEIKDFGNRADLTQITGMKQYIKLNGVSKLNLGIDTKGAVDDNGRIIGGKLLQKQVYELFPFNYYFVKQFTCSTGLKNMLFGKKEKVVNDIKLIPFNSESLK
jgi:hypothetical protein